MGEMKGVIKDIEYEWIILQFYSEYLVPPLGGNKKICRGYLRKVKGPIKLIDGAWFWDSGLN